MTIKRPRALLLMAMILAACTGGGVVSTASVTSTMTTIAVTTTAPTTATTTTTASTTTTIDDAEERPRIVVEDGEKVEGPDRLGVKVGETVIFLIEADVADEVHVHGFDLHFDTVPGEEVVIEFVASAAGIFEIELEGARLHLLDVEVTP
ncbi:MAG: hypothetical protein Q8Q52_05375 [Acidimicrobiia bacterium]|nr:hypothetical protein [Acidimicrobiia bacterium]